MKYYYFWLLLLGSLSTYAQHVTNTTGATIANNNYYLEYSVGEISIASLPGNVNAITQGLLQPQMKVSDPTCDIMEKPINYFENPSMDKIRLVGIYNWIRSYQIFAADGRLVRSEDFFNNYIDISGLPAAGIYFIRILPGCNNQYQIIKFMKR